MKAESISTKKLKSTTMDLEAELVNVVSLEAQNLWIEGNLVTVAKKLGVTGWGKIRGETSILLGSVYATNLEIEGDSIEIGSINGDIKVKSIGHVIIDSIEGDVSIESLSAYIACKSKAQSIYLKT